MIVHLHVFVIFIDISQFQKHFNILSDQEHSAFHTDDLYLQLCILQKQHS